MAAMLLQCFEAAAPARQACFSAVCPNTACRKHADSFRSTPP